MRRASLPMYDFDELRSATDAWWQGLARAFRAAGVADVPDALARGEDCREQWRAPDLLFGQTCGYPFIRGLSSHLRLVATPYYRAEGCAGPLYRSRIVVREDSAVRTLADLRGKVCAVNNPHSHSGYNALRASIAPLSSGGRFFARVLVTGGHPASLAALRRGEAEVCAVDCVTHALIRRCRPDLAAGTRVLCDTAPAPGLPYVTACGAEVERLRAGLARALADPDLAAAREALLIAGAEPLPESAYRCIGAMEEAAIAAGYAEVA